MNARNGVHSTMSLQYMINSNDCNVAAVRRFTYSYAIHVLLLVATKFLKGGGVARWMVRKAFDQQTGGVLRVDARNSSLEKILSCATVNIFVQHAIYYSMRSLILDFVRCSDSLGHCK